MTSWVALLLLLLLALALVHHCKATAGQVV
jgi:hypothetical protein